MAYLDLILFQQDLHPDSVFMGCLSTDWTKIQQAHLVRNQLPWDKQQADNTMKSILTYLMKVVHSVWLTRNLVLHGDDAMTQLRSYKYTQLLLDIQDLYDQQAHMLVSDRRLFVHPYEYWLGQSTNQLKTFLKRMRPTMRTSM
jgi:UDP-2,3-diacylglucosamine pyrophosphatase LpxH